MDDTISRQAAIDALAVYIHNVDKVYSTGLMSADDCKDAAHSVLDDLPSAQPQRMRGRWIEHKWAEEVGGFLISNYACSCCSSWERTDSNYCPNCGSYNGGEQDGFN